MAFFRRDGKELYYLAADRSVMSVPVTLSPDFKFEKPKVLFRPAESALTGESLPVSKGVDPVDGEEVPVHEGTALRFDPETTRCPVSGPDGMSFIAIGARRGSYDARGPF